jgi:hypothetical protein
MPLVGEAVEVDLPRKTAPRRAQRNGGTIRLFLR